MVRRSQAFFGLAAVAVLALWLAFAAPEQILGIDTGKTGFALLVIVGWLALYVLHRMPGSASAPMISPGEWRAWIGLLFMAQILGYLLWKSDVLINAPLLHNPHARAVGNHVAMLFIAWLVVSQVMKSRWRGEVQEDERDREIGRIAANWGSGALTLCVIGVMVTLGLSPAERLNWATPMMVAHMLLFALLWATLIEHAVAAIQYWHDRH
ncbi:MAG: hypothetical protein CVV15_07345 [Gammaproteobacteria bacterium HGW-Gammaproteobacteria-5]|jgi:uncharacterized membrane protein|nr:MAG: hypothetical protein CVV15_07345 [Gammaproteobacteria bacterium HGW-Gammaproteobacteria-5]